MYDSIIKLISEQKAVNDYGDLETTKTYRTVFADCRSIGQSEFYQAQSVGLKPEIKFVLADYLEYKGEQKLLYSAFDSEELEYTVLRTFRNNNELELVCVRGVE